jgi:hypothetical protein
MKMCVDENQKNGKSTGNVRPNRGYDEKIFTAQRGKDLSILILETKGV